MIFSVGGNWVKQIGVSIAVVAAAASATVFFRAGTSGGGVGTALTWRRLGGRQSVAIALEGDGMF